MLPGNICARLHLFMSAADACVCNSRRACGLVLCGPRMWLTYMYRPLVMRVLASWTRVVPCFPTHVLLGSGQQQQFPLALSLCWAWPTPLCCLAVSFSGRAVKQDSLRLSLGFGMPALLVAPSCMHQSALRPACGAKLARRTNLLARLGLRWSARFWCEV